MNVSGLSERTLRRDFEKSGVTVTSDIQVAIIVCTYMYIQSIDPVPFTYTVKSLGCSSIRT